MTAGARGPGTAARTGKSPQTAAASTSQGRACSRSESGSRADQEARALRRGQPLGHRGRAASRGRVADGEGAGDYQGLPVRLPEAPSKRGAGGTVGSGAAGEKRRREEGRRSGLVLQPPVRWANRCATPPPRGHVAYYSHLPCSPGLTGSSKSAS